MCRSISAKAGVATMNWTVTGDIGAQPECSRPNAFSSLLLPRKSWENRGAMGFWTPRGQPLSNRPLLSEAVHIGKC